MPQSITPAVLNAADQVEHDLGQLDVSTRALLQLLRAGDQQGGATGGPDGTEYYFTLTVQASQVATDLTNFPVYVNLANAPAAFWTNVQSNGGDIRVTGDDGTTRCAVDLVSINTGTSAGELHFLAGSISSSVDTVFRVYYGKTGGGLSQPAVGGTYGRNAVWADYQIVWHLNEDPSGSAPQTIDSTGNGHNGSSSGSMTTGDLVTGQVGLGVQFDGTNDKIETPDAAALTLPGDFTISVWHKIDSLSGVEFIASADAGATSADGWYFVTSATTGNWAALIRDAGTGYGITTSSGFVANDASWHYASMRRDGTTLRIKQDTSADVTTACSSGSIDSPNPVALATRQSDTFLAATLDEFRLRKSLLSGDWLDAEFVNQSTPTTFYAVGAETPA